MDSNEQEARIEMILKEIMKGDDIGYSLRRAYGFLFLFPWSASGDGWVIHPKDKPWEKVITVKGDFKVVTYGNYFPTFSWEIAETLWINFPKANVTINDQPIRKWSRVVIEKK